MGRSTGIWATPKLREMRMVAGFELQEFATAADISDDYLSKIERKERRTTQHVAKRIARALGFRSLKKAVEAGVFTIDLDLPA